MPIFDTVVQSVTQRVVQKKSGGTATIFDILDSEGRKWSTWRQPLANESNRLIGQAVELSGRIEQNGQYQNYLVDDIRAATVSANRAAQAAQAAQHAQPQHQTVPTRQQNGEVVISQDGPDDRQWSIMRQTAGKVSAQISNDPSSFWANLDPLLTYFAYGLKPPEFEGVSNTVRNDPHEREPNQFISESSYNDPGRESPFGDADLDIPFNPTSGPHGY